jgi:hypothetical protein
MSEPDKLAIAAHLHVLLRRKTGRVTDTEWMAANADYAQEIVRFARQRAQDDNIPELIEWANRLDTAIHAPAPPAPRRPWLDVSTQGAPQRTAQSSEPALDGPRYVGGIR